MDKASENAAPRRPEDERESARRRRHPAAAPKQVLVVEDDPEYGELVIAILRSRFGKQTDITHRTTVAGSVEFLADNNVECILLDLNLPDASPDDYLSPIKAAGGDTPIVILSGDDSEERAVKLVQQGAQDYLLKQTTNPELLARAIRYSIERKEAELNIAAESLLDQLTGLPNRRLLEDRLTVALAESIRSKRRLAVVFIDLDGFKQVNDRLGHDAGDIVLVSVAHALRNETRAGDTISRFGGDEFVLLCTELAADEDATTVAERIIERLGAPHTVSGERLTVSASIGIAIGDGATATSKSLLAAADQVMYEGKRDGTGIGIHREGVKPLDLRPRDGRKGRIFSRRPV